MGAVPIIMAAVAVAGTAAQVSAQQSSVRANNRAVDAQISANKDYESIRKMNARAQRGIINQQAKLAQMSIVSNIQAERAQLLGQRVGLLQQLAQQQQVQKVEQAQFRNAVAGEQRNLQTARQDSERAAETARGQGMAEAAQAVAQLPDPTRDIEKLKDEVDVRAMQIQAYTGTRGRTSELQQKLTPEQITAVAGALQEQRGISAQAAKAVASSASFARIANQMAQAQIDQQDVAFNQATRDATRQAGFEKRLGGQQTRAATQQIDLAMQGTGLSKRLNLSDNRTNRLFALGSLITGQGLGAAQAAASNAQALSQRQSGPSLLGQLSSYGSALTPFLSQLQGTPTSRFPALGQGMPNLQASAGVVGAGYGSQGSLPVSNKNFAGTFQTSAPSKSFPVTSRTLNFGGS